LLDYHGSDGLPAAVDQLLNVAFFVFHTSWVVFNCVGWMWRRTRRWHLATVALTAASWFGLGVMYGWGYCPCTDWHWQVRERLGYRDPPSYMQLLIAEVTGGLDLPSTAVDVGTVAVLLIVAVLSIVLNVRDRRRRVVL
jgi:hypothetical protein